MELLPANVPAHVNRVAEQLTTLILCCACNSCLHDGGGHCVKSIGNILARALRRNRRK